MAEIMFHVVKTNLIAAVIILLTVLLSRLTKQKYSLKWKYFMWMAVSVFLLIPVNVSNRSPIRLQIVKQTAYPSGVQQTDNFLESSGKEGGKGLDAAGQGIGRDAGEPDAQTSGHITISIPSDKVSVCGILEIFGIIWIIGMVFSVITKVLRYYFSLHKITRWSYPVEDKKTLELYRWICLKKHIRRPPRLLISPELSTPVLAGLRHTGLYLTEEEYDMEEQRFILCHELTHYRRGDLWYKTLLLAANTVYWFNPALYWMRSEAEKDIENLCDGSVVENYTREEQMKYSRLLLKTAALQNHVSYLASSLNDSTLIFKERILYMRNLQHLKTNVVSVAALTVMMVAIQLLVGSTVRENALVVGRSASFTEGIAAGQDGNEGTRNGKVREQQDTRASYGEKVDASASAPEGLTADRISASGGLSANGILASERLPASGISASEELSANGVSASEELPANGVSASGGLPTNGISASEGLQANGTAGDGFQDNSLTGDAWPDGLTAGAEAPELPAEQGYTLTNQQITLYEVAGKGANYVNKATDGSWYDGSGRQYAQNGNNQWICLTNGTAWTDSAPASPADHMISQSSVIDAEGYNQATLYQQEDGSWQNIAGGVYADNGDGTWTGPNGTIWYLN